MNNKTVLTVLTLAILTFVLLDYVTNSDIDKSTTRVFKSEVKNLRFQKVETFVFQKIHRDTVTAVIYEDTKTGIKYLYIWEGINGGPCITRLWEE